LWPLLGSFGPHAFLVEWTPNWYCRIRFILFFKPDTPHHAYLTKVQVNIIKCLLMRNAVVEPCIALEHCRWIWWYDGISSSTDWAMPKKWATRLSTLKLSIFSGVPVPKCPWQCWSVSSQALKRHHQPSTATERQCVVSLFWDDNNRWLFEEMYLPLLKNIGKGSSISQPLHKCVAIMHAQGKTPIIEHLMTFWREKQAAASCLTWSRKIEGLFWQLAI